MPTHRDETAMYGAPEFWAGLEAEEGWTLSVEKKKEEEWGG
jgi:hypothetical protein